jgi:hypothetical protein
MIDKQHAHNLVERLPADQMTAAVRFLEFLLLSPLDRALATAPEEDEEISEEEEAAVARSKEWLKHNQPIPHEEVLAEFGLTMADFERLGRTPRRTGPNGSRH